MKLEWCTQEGGRLKADQWLPCKEVSHNILLQQTEAKLWSLHCLQQAWGHVLLHGTINRRKLIAAADQLHKVTDAIEAAEEYL